MMLKDRCIGVFDLESPVLDAFTKRDVEILTLLASQAAVAIENARLYAEASANEARLEKELGFAKRVQAALLPSQLPKRIKGVDVAARFASARELGGDFHDFLVPDRTCSRSPSATFQVRASRPRSTACSLANWSAVARSAAGICRARVTGEGVDVDQHHPPRAPARGVLLHALLRVFDLKRRMVTLANSGLPYPIRATRDRTEQISLPGVPLGSFQGVTYDELSFPLEQDDIYVFCSDGVSEAMNRKGEEFTAERAMAVVDRSRQLSAKDMAAALVAAVEEHRAGHPPNDDMTVVVLKMTEAAKN
jgi:serine phosphatase RsbU (regulator of sigma subunit)